MVIDAPACVDCRKYGGCLLCEVYAEGIPQGIILGKHECDKFTGSTDVPKD